MMLFGHPILNQSNYSPIFKLGKQGRRFKFLPSIFLFLICLLLLTGCGTPESEVAFQPVSVEVQGKGLVIVREADLDRMGVRFPETGGVKVMKGAEEIPAWMLELEDVGTQKSLVFYAAPEKNRFSPVDTYQIIQTVETMPVLQSAPPGFGTASIPVQVKIRLEEDILYEPLSDAEFPFLWQTITGSKPFEIGFNLDSLTVNSSARLTLSLRKRGAVDLHRVEIRINQVDLGNVTWEGSPEVETSIEIPPGTLKEEDNRLMLTIQGEGAEQMVADLDWIEVQYFQDDPMERDFLSWTATGDYQSMGGWAGLTVTIPVGGGEGWVSQAGLGGVMSYITIPGQDYVTADESGWTFPSLLRPLHTVDALSRAFSGADYIILTPPAWKDDLEPLADFIRTQGMKPTIVTLDAVYDRFNHGQAAPVAIQAFLQYTLERWELPPRYALLVGDFSYNPANLPENGNYLPTFFIKTQLGGETASDFPFSLDREDQPRIAVGRWPVENREELSRLIQARIEEERATGTPFQILGLADPSDVTFGQSLDIFEKLLKTENPSDNPINIKKVQTDEIPTGDYDILVYIGHGSLTQWGSPALMTADTFREKWAKKPELILQFTCLTGYFIEPAKRSLSEDFLLEGVPAVIAPTSLTLPGDQWGMMENWAKALANSENVRIGDLLLSIWQSVGQNAVADDVLKTFLLLGDPAYPIFGLSRE